MATESFRNSDGILSPYEAEHMVEHLECFALKDVGSDKWMQQHEVLEKLNIQAHHNALTKHDEYVVDAFVAHGKIAVLVHELLVVEAWKEKVLPVILPKLNSFTAMKAYIIAYHEATICNLLEVIMYHESACESAEDSLSELVDYCYRKISLLNAGSFDEGNQKAEVSGPASASKAVENEQSIEKQLHTVGFAVAVCAVTIMRFITDHVSALPIGVVTRIVDGHDMILSFVALVERPPWTRRVGSVLEKFIDQKWMAVPPADRFKLTQIEGQVWLGLYNLMMDKECRSKYHFNTYRKEIILKLRKCFNDVLIDQLPLLKDLRRFVEELVLADPPAPTQSALVVVEQIPEIRSEILDGCDFAAIAKQQLSTAFRDDPEQRKRDIARLAATYNLDNFDEVLEQPTCAAPNCGADAVKRCSRCKVEWYCSRECQVKCWKNHKPLCDVISTSKPAPSEAKRAETKTADGIQTKKSKSHSSAKGKGPMIEELD